MDTQLFADVLATYNPDSFKAPLIVSHNTYGRGDAELAESELAYGFPARLKRVGQRIVAQFERVSPLFREWWENGQLMSFSPSLYRPDSPNNPYPGKWSLRHIAALGKSPPAQKDLGQPIGLSEFAKKGFGIPEHWVLNLGEFDLPNEDGTVSLSGGGVLPMVLRNLREYFLVEKGQETADRLVPEYAISEAEMDDDGPEMMALKDELVSMMSFRQDYEDMMGRFRQYEQDFGWGRKKEDDMMGCGKQKPAMFAEGQPETVVNPTSAGTMPDPKDKTAETPAANQDFSEFERKLAALEKQNQQLEAQLKAEERRARVAQITNFCEEHRSRLTFDPTQPAALDFGEGEEKSLVDFMAELDDKGLSFMQSLIKALPQQVPTGEVATDFSEPAPAANFSEAITEARQKLQALMDSNRNGGAQFSEGITEAQQKLQALMDSNRNGGAQFSEGITEAQQKLQALMDSNRNGGAQ